MTTTLEGNPRASRISFSRENYAIPTHQAGRDDRLREGAAATLGKIDRRGDDDSLRGVGGVERAAAAILIRAVYTLYILLYIFERLFCAN